MDSALILIADDSVVNLQLLTSALEKKYRTTIAINGREALECARTQHPDLILLDIIMPHLDGFEVCRILKNDPATKEIPIIFLTSMNETKSIVKGFEIGAADFITKPFNQRELLARVNTHLELKFARDNQNRLIAELQKAVDEIKTLRGLIPICSVCKKIRNDQDLWERIEIYISKHTEAEFTHSLCPECLKERYPELYSKVMIYV